MCSCEPSHAAILHTDSHSEYLYEKLRAGDVELLWGQCALLTAHVLEDHGKVDQVISDHVLILIREDLLFHYLHCLRDDTSFKKDSPRGFDIPQRNEHPPYLPWEPAAWRCGSPRRCLRGCGCILWPGHWHALWGPWQHAACCWFSLRNGWARRQLEFYPEWERPICPLLSEGGDRQCMRCLNSWWGVWLFRNVVPYYLPSTSLQTGRSFLKSVLMLDLHCTIKTQVTMSEWQWGKKPDSWSTKWMKILLLMYL